MSQPKKVVQVGQVPGRGPGRPRGRPPSNIRFTVKPPTVTKQQQEAKLRAQVEKEITSRSRTCTHRGYACSQPVLPEREHCARHILEDPAAPYRQCTYVYNSGKRCPLAAPAGSDAAKRDMLLCFEHARVSLAARQRTNTTPPAETTTETLLYSLQHYVKAERVRTASCASAVSVVSEPSDDQGAPQFPVDPFKQMDACAINSVCWSAPLDRDSDDSEADSVRLGGAGTRAPDDDLEHQPSVDLEGQAPLRYAGVYTAEEAVSEARMSLRLLQAAYMRQLARLRAELHEARAQYLRALRAEREVNCSINQQTRARPQSVKERKQLKKLKAYASYHKKHGVNAVLARKLYHKRAKVGQHAPPRCFHGRCLFSEGGVRCEAQSTPASKYCLKHILHDTNQVLFGPCGEVRAGMACVEPAPALGVHGVACRYHQAVPQYTVFSMKKDETDSESDTNTATESIDSRNDVM